jgi:predicted kinase
VTRARAKAKPKTRARAKPKVAAGKDRAAGPAQPPALITVVTGPPCAGKTTHVAEHRDPADLVLDLDAMAGALGYPADHVAWDDDHPAVHAARMARAHVLSALLTGRIAGTAWVIDARPDDVRLIRYHRAGAEFVHLDPGREACLARAADRSPSTLERIESWYRSDDETQADDPPAALGVFA